MSHGITCFHAFSFFLLGFLDASRIQGGVLEDAFVTCAIHELSVMKYHALGCLQKIFEGKENLTQITEASLMMNAHHTFGTYA